MRTVIRVLLYDVLLGLVYIGFDAYLAWWYFSQGHKWWGALTLGAVALPGTLETLCYTYSYLHGDLAGTRWQQFKEYCFWIFFFGPVLFPFSLLVWHLVQICKGEGEFHKFETLARSRVLSSLSVLTKSAMQLCLQVTILMITWLKHDSLPYHTYQLVSIGLSTLIIAKSCSDHHYFEISGKNVRVRSPYCQLIVRMIFNIFHIICRGAVLALLASYLHYLSLAFIGAMIVLNYIISNIIIKTDGSKHFWTAFAAVLLPNCFISRDTVELLGQQETRRKFKTFYRVNSLLFFFLIGVGALVTANCLIFLTDFIQFNCANLPFLSYDAEQNCPPNSPIKDIEIAKLLPPHSGFLVFGSVGVFVLSLLQVISIFFEESILSKDYEPVPRL